MPRDTRLMKRASVAAVVAGLLFSTVPRAMAANSSPTLAEVAQHNKATDCWTVVAGNVYNLTKWVQRHPGGSAAIKGMCGKDATAAFTNMHGSSATAAQALARFKIGQLAAEQPATAAPPETSPTTAPAPAPKSGITAAEVRAHSTPANCWVVVGSRVYDLSGWSDRHPGGTRAITAACGKNGTAAFAGVGEHGASSVRKMLAAFKVGKFDASQGALANARGEGENEGGEGDDAD